MKQLNNEIKLKGYSIKTKIIEIEEHRDKYKKGNTYRQPFICYSYNMFTSTSIIQGGRFKTKEELLKDIGLNL